MSPGDRTSADHAELAAMLRRAGVLTANAEQPISGRDGTRVPWMFYSWNCSLTAAGAALAARCLLARLQSFRGTQLAAYGYTGIPLLTACVAAGGGRYTGLVIREIRKEYGSSRRIEGPANKAEPVIVIDDSLSSGTSLRRAVQALEEDGFRVEGALVLVHFPNRGGLEWASSLGYRVESLFDAWADLGAPRRSFVPGHQRFASSLWSEERLPNGLHPAEAARQAVTTFLNTGLMPSPPLSLDRDYDGRGGVYVSFRERASDHRIARDGFWHFEPADSEPCRDVVLAAVKTIQSASGQINLNNLGALKIAVSFFTPLEKVAPGQLDFSRYGIVVRSRGAENKMGGALPNTQVYTSEIEQYTHARWRNAKIPTCEPHDLFRHDIVKCVEQGEYWLPFGTYDDPHTHWTNDKTIGEALTARAEAALEAAKNGTALSGQPLPADLIPAPVSAVAVTLYRRGVRGCFVTWDGSLDECVVRAAQKALTDTRFADSRRETELSIAVSILHDREWLGETSFQKAAIKLRPGRDSMGVQQGKRRAILLASVASHFEWTKEQFVRALLKKAGIAKPPYVFASYKTATWLKTPSAVHKIDFGFPERLAAVSNDETRWESSVDALATYIVRSLQSNGLPLYYYSPVTGRRVSSGSAARVVHALGALARAGAQMNRPDWSDAGRRGIGHCLALVSQSGGKSVLQLPGEHPNAMADAQLLIAALDAGFVPGSLTRLAKRASSMLQPDGRVSDVSSGLGLASEHDFLPGAVLLAIGKYDAATGASRAEALSSQLEWYRRRFRLLHPWGMVGWQTQAWAAIHGSSAESSHAAFVFEMADWALDWQHEGTGSFVCDLHAGGPSFHTAFIAEGMAAAWALALQTGDSRRAAKYSEACRRALVFMDQLIVSKEDTYCMDDPARAAGGVRLSRNSAGIRIDFVSHTLLAFLACLENARQHASARSPVEA